MDDRRFKHILKFMEWGELNDWELNFVEKMEEKWAEKGELSEKEEDKLEEIGAKDAT